MSKFKKYQCKCSICNKPFSAYSPDEDKCRKCKEDEQVKKLTEAGYAPKKVLVRNRHDCIEVNMAVSDAQFAKDLAEARRKNKIAHDIVCRDCGESFELTVGELEWYSEHNLVEPTRCPFCREKRKKMRMANHT